MKHYRLLLLTLSLWCSVALNGLDIYKNNTQLTIEALPSAPDISWADSHIFYVSEKQNNDEDRSLIGYLQQTIAPNLSVMLQKQQFSGKKDKTAVIPVMFKDQPVHLIFIGLGNLDRAFDVEREDLRRSAAHILPIIQKHQLTRVTLTLPTYLETVCKAPEEELLQQIALAYHMASYSPDYYKSDKPNSSITMRLTSHHYTPSQLEPILRTAELVGKTINEARFWADSPPNILTPATFSTRILERAQSVGNLSCSVIDTAMAHELGMGAFCAVAQGSSNDGRFVVLEYKTPQPNAPMIALCGKGITFDTGGVSLKTRAGMTGMKYDMSGAAAVVATMLLIAQLQPKCNVIGITPLAENMPDGNAYRQDDIVKALNGKTIEIKNTDAEGRLVLADALSYVGKYYKPTIVIDIATLTGACKQALGNFHSGLFTRDNELATLLEEAGNITGDRVWRLPLTDDHTPGIKSTYADLGNMAISAYDAGGAIMAASFLEQFVPAGARWAHLDIASTANGVPGTNYVGKSATGCGIRLLLEFIMNYSQK